MKRKKNLKHPIDLKNKKSVVQQNQVGKQPFYSSDLSRDEENAQTNNETDIPATDLGGTVKREDVMDQNTVGSTAGKAGGAGIDDDTG